MVYRAPENFFEDFEQRITDAVAAGDMPGSGYDAEAIALMPGRRSQVRVWLSACGAAAAVALLLLAAPLKTGFASQPQLTAEQAFSQLSEADRDMIMDDYNFMFSADDCSF